MGGPCGTEKLIFLSGVTQLGSNSYWVRNTQSPIPAPPQATPGLSSGWIACRAQAPVRQLPRLTTPLSSCFTSGPSMAPHCPPDDAQTFLRHLCPRCPQPPKIMLLPARTAGCLLLAPFIPFFQEPTSALIESPICFINLCCYLH